MKRLFVAAAALLALAACDPTKKHDYGCTQVFGKDATKAQGCVQFHISESEGNVAEVACEDNDKADGSWAYHACESEGRIDGYCRVDDAKDYSLSGTEAKVYFYDPTTALEAEVACTSGGGVWVASGR